MSKFEYPQLPRADIIGGLADFGNIGVSETDLRNPNPEFIANIYARILTFLDILNEDSERVDFSALEQLENPEYHQTSVRIVNLLKKTKELLAAMSCPVNFSLRDLIKPDPNRTEMFLSAMVNFCIFRESKMELVKPIVEEHRLVEDQGKESEDRILQLTAEIDVINESREMEKPLVKAVDAKVKQLRQTIPGLNNQQMSLKASLKKMKEKGKNIDENISSAVFRLVQSVQENASLHSKIVQSPDKLQKTLEEKKIVQAEAKDAERTSMQSYQEQNGTFEIYTKAHNKLLKTLAQVEGIQEQVNSAKVIEKDVKVLKVKHSDEDMLDKTLEAKLVEKQGRVEQVEESSNQLGKERDFRYEEGNKELNNVKFEVELMKWELQLRQQKIEADAAVIASITEEIDAIKEVGITKRQQLVAKSEEIVAEFFNYNNSIGISCQIWRWKLNLCMEEKNRV